MKYVAIAAALVATVVSSSAYANWFDAFLVGEGHKKEIGATVTPTPDDLRAIGDSSYGEGKVYHYDEKTGHYHEVKDKPDEKPTLQPDPGKAPAANAPQR